MADVVSEVTAIIVNKLGVDESEVTRNASFTNDLGADSLDTVELIMEFEKKFNIEIPDGSREDFDCRRGYRLHRGAYQIITAWVLGE